MYCLFIFGNYYKCNIKLNSDKLLTNNSKQQHYVIELVKKTTLIDRRYMRKDRKRERETQIKYDRG